MMGIEEKLAKCVEFIRSIERGDAGAGMFVDGAEINKDSEFRCKICGGESFEGTGTVRIPLELRDKAWHLLADIDGL